MPGNAGNTSNARRNLRRVQMTGAVLMAAFEVFVLVEILWYFLSDGEQTFHDAVKDYRRERAEYRESFRITREHIRNLPETDGS